MLTAEEITFRKACRQNTGAHMLDSGGAYGRHHERPLIDESSLEVLVRVDPKYEDPDLCLEVALETGGFLDNLLEIDRDLHRQYEKWLEVEDSDNRMNWFETGQSFMEDILGYCQEERGNVYNNENDLTQMYVWEVYNRDPKLDWMYKEDDTVTVIYIHTGCDVRGGYGQPIFCRAKGEYAIPIDVVAEVDLIEGTDAEGEPLDDEERERRCEEWQAGYSSAPLFQFFRDVDSVLSDAPIVEDGLWPMVWVKLKDGITAKVQFSYRQEQ